MLSEKQIEAAAKVLFGLSTSLTNPSLINIEWKKIGPYKRATYRQRAKAALTAAEQAEPALMPDDCLRSQIGNIGNEVHNIACERQNDEGLRERLSDIRTRLWEIAKHAPIEPAPPAARSGAVKVKPLEWVRGWMNAEAQTDIGLYQIAYRRDGSFEWCFGVKKEWASSWDAAKAAAQADYERRILAALEPAEPASDAEPYLWLHPWDGRTSKHRSDIAADCPKDGPQPIPLYARPPESRLREALEHVTELLVDTWNTKMEGDPERQIAVRDACAALAQGADDERS